MTRGGENTAPGSVLFQMMQLFVSRSSAVKTFSGSGKHNSESLHSGGGGGGGKRATGWVGDTRRRSVQERKEGETRERRR